MRVLRRIPTRPVRWKNPVGAIGIFDGVHRGHQVILHRAVTRARALRGVPVAVTFHPHPLTVLNPALLPPLLLSLDQRLEAFEACGIRGAVVIPFTRAFSRWSPELFIRRLLVERLRLKEVIVGHDFGFGAGRVGTVETLRQLGRRYGFKVHVVAPIKAEGERIASHRIRLAIREGYLTRAARLLNRPVTAVGVGVRGVGRGRKLGFPTVNLRLEAGVLPPVGVYAVNAKIGARHFPGMANIGFRPTFEKKRRPRPALPLLEVHLFGINRPLYGKRLEVSFCKRLRSERRFPSAEALKRQLEVDAHRAKRIFALQRKGIMV